MKLFGFLAVVGIVVAVGTVCSRSKNPLVHLFGTLLFVAISLSLTAFTIFLGSVGGRNHWASDGPGMLIVIIAIFVFGGAALGSWTLTGSLFFGRPRQ